MQLPSIEAIMLLKKGVSVLKGVDSRFIKFTVLLVFLVGCGGNSSDPSLNDPQGENVIPYDQSSLKPVSSSMMGLLKSFMQCEGNQAVDTFYTKTSVAEISHAEGWYLKRRANFFLHNDWYEFRVITQKKCFDHSKCKFCNSYESCKKPIKKMTMYYGKANFLENNLQLENLGYIEGHSYRSVSIVLKAKDSDLLGLNRTRVELFPGFRSCDL